MSVVRILAAGCCLLLLAGCETTSGTPGTAPSAASPSFKLSNLFGSANSGAETTSSIDGSQGSVLMSAADPPSAVDDTYSPASNPDAKALLGGDRYDDLSMAKRFFRDGNYGLAERYFRRAAETGPRDAEAWLGLAASYDRLKRFDLADRAYAQVLKLRGSTPEILNNIGYSYMLRGDYPRARQKLQEAHARDPANPYVNANLALLDESQTRRKAIR